MNCLLSLDTKVLSFEQDRVTKNLGSILNNLLLQAGFEFCLKHVDGH